jgi:hypothetical protein
LEKEEGPHVVERDELVGIFARRVCRHGTGGVLARILPEVKTRAEYSESETYEGLSRVREVLSSCSGHRLVPRDEVRSWFLSSHQGDVAQTDRVVPAQPNSQLSNQKSPDRLGVGTERDPA